VDFGLNFVDEQVSSVFIPYFTLCTPCLFDMHLSATKLSYLVPKTDPPLKLFAPGDALTRINAPDLRRPLFLVAGGWLF